MHGSARRRGLSVLFVAAAVAALAGGVGLVSSSGSSAPQARLPQVPGTARLAGATVLTVGGPYRGRAIPSGFLGLSLEYQSVEAYAGEDPNAIDPVFEQLIRNLTPGQMPVLRIGGDTTDWTWWPIPHMVKPGGVRITLDRRWLQVTSALAQALGARLILGINLEADSRRLAAAEARALVGGIGRGRIAELELGNEPELHGSFAWYVTHGRKVTGRPHGYNFGDFIRDVSRIRAVLPRIPLAGPAVGGPSWMPLTGRFVAAEPRLGVVTLHRYPLQVCFKRPSSPMYPTISHLFASRASRGLAEGVARYVALSHRRGIPLRIDEMNSVSCGVEHRISDAFASSLWALDALFEMARVGLDGVNIHSYPGASSELFTFRRVHQVWRAFVKPDYYGLLMFAQATPPGSRLLRISRPAGRRIKVWATRAPDGRIRVVLINQGTGGPRVVAVRVPAAAGNATVERLQAPSLYAHHGVTLGGQGFGTGTTTGRLAGRSHIVSVTLAGGAYDVKLPSASATMLTLASR